MNNFQRNIYRLYTEVITPTITCNATAASGGSGVTEYTIQLDKPLGGIVIMDFNAQGIVDKLEIIHNGVKKATSGMTTVNAGPFDNIYGEPTIPNTTQANAIDQFIGTSKGAVPNRDSIFLSETGITDIVRTKQQLIWWVYTQTDYELLNNVIVRVTGISGTAWDLQRLCTDQTPRGVIPSVTFSPNTSCISDTGIFDTTIMGTVTIVGASFEFRATAYTYSSPAGSINTEVSMDNQTNINAARTTIGQSISTSFVTLTPGIYNYQIRVNSNSAIGDGGGCIDVTQVL